MLSLVPNREVNTARDVRPRCTVHSAPEGEADHVVKRAHEKEGGHRSAESPDQLKNLSATGADACQADGSARAAKRHLTKLNET